VCRNVLLFEAIAATGRGVTIAEACKLLPAIPAGSVESAAYRLSISGALTMQRQGNMILYSANPNAQPTDKRGRPRMAPDINRSI
jgi:hypothetical protein